MKNRDSSKVACWLRHESIECRLDTRGRITIPKGVRERMHWVPGDRIRFTIRRMGVTTVNSGDPDLYYVVLKRLREKIPREINLEA